jgi:hypothetical protein
MMVVATASTGGAAMVLINKFRAKTGAKGMVIPAKAAEFQAKEKAA